MTSSWYFVGVLLGLGMVVQAAKLPNTWGRCSRKDKDFAECIRKNLEIAIRSLNKPIPELGLASCDPLNIPGLYIGEGKGAVNVAQDFKNVKLHGISNAVVYNSSFDFEKKEMIAESLSPELRLEADYTMKGQVLLLPIVGNGPCNVTLVNMRIKHKMNFEYIEKKGKTYMKALDFKVTMNPEKVLFKFDNLFDGQNKELGTTVNKVLNDNSLEVFNDVRNGYEISFGEIFKDLCNRVFHKVPVKDIFLV
ncbi:unnamed protein product [Ceutorhynchus assimilis]|uniref:Protein takeout n=1 Tax=Ceutorhynchus assimilis TaxID=467358 RepID=A0A9N9QJG4_9CUCU|nr:unnamed protein product [Ceutorhynchus assimilis]